MCTYTHNIKMDTLARIKHKFTHVQIEQNTQMYKYTCANRTTLYTSAAGRDNNI
jgi:hypothetical protein